MPYRFAELSIVFNDQHPLVRCLRIGHAEQIVPLGPDAAFVRGRYHLDFSDGEAADGLFTLVLRRVDDRWRIVHDHTSSASE